MELNARNSAILFIGVCVEYNYSSTESSLMHVANFIEREGTLFSEYTYYFILRVDHTMCK